MTYNTHLKENISLLQHIKVLYCPFIFKYGFGSLEYQIQRGHHLALQIPLSFLGDGFHHVLPLFLASARPVSPALIVSHIFATFLKLVVSVYFDTIASVCFGFRLCIIEMNLHHKRRQIVC